jgi:sulfate/thiosulfate transport system permease protein
MAASAATRGGPWVPRLLVGGAVAVLVILVVLPLLLIFGEAFAKGAAGYRAALADPDTLAAIRMTLLIAVVVVPLNTGFGIVAAWCIAKFEFPGKSALVTLIEVPLSVSPVVSGLVFVLLFGARGWFGPYLASHDIKIIFATAGMILVTLFVTLPFVARQLIPLMQQQGLDEEESAIVLGANGLQTFFRVTLPNIRWGLLYGVLLCNARAMGEFGAVSVVSGHIRGATITMPLQVEIFYNDYNSVAAFAVASLLALLGLLTLAVRRVMEWRYGKDLRTLPRGITA